MIEIVSRWDKTKVLYRAEAAQDIRAAVVEAVREGADLRAANLGNADLGGANLGSANLRGADLRRADLGEANLRGANLREADLRGADLRGADLWGANLWGADLRSANLRSANLWGADLRSANLRSANLWGADLRGADLRSANLWGANLWDANLWDANLGGANLWGAEGAPLVVEGLPSGSALIHFADGEWQIRVGCWTGTPDELETLLEGTDWPEAKGDERERRRPGLAALVALCRAHIAYVEATAPADDHKLKDDESEVSDV